MFKGAVRVQWAAVSGLCAGRRVCVGVGQLYMNDNPECSSMSIAQGK